jgi:exopolyphosphatase/guanosine-5'-triphosphate,3'-diphosphate pyrophosphatase
MKPRVRAAIDIGTNSVKLTVLRLGAGRPRSLHEEVDLSRPGEGVRRTGRLDPRAVRRAVRSVRRYAAVARRLGDPDPIVVATEWLRKARNRESFLAALGRPCRLLSGREEAALSYLGARTMLGIEAPMVDLGGGSAEFLVGRGGRLVRSATLPVGALFLTERFLRHDPPDEGELRALDRYLDAKLGSFRTPRADRVVGIGGSVAALAFSLSRARRFDPERFNGSRIPVAALARLERALAAVPCRIRVSRFRLEPGRADVIVAGARLLLRFMRLAGAKTLVVCTYGVRHGAVLAAPDALPGAVR